MHKIAHERKSGRARKVESSSAKKSRRGGTGRRGTKRPPSAVGSGTEDSSMSTV